MKINKIKTKNSGFTIVELMIATAVFSFVLLVTSAGVIAIGRNYYKAITSNTVQTAARSVMDDVSRSLQFSQVSSISALLTNPDGTPATVKARCFGSDRYTYVINQQVKSGNHALYRDKRPSLSSCTPGGFTGGVELLGPNMRLLQFDVSNANPFQITIGLAYGDNDLLSTYNNQGNPLGGVITDGQAAGTTCKTVAGNQFCAISKLESSVTSRVE